MTIKLKGADKYYTPQTVKKFSDVDLKNELNRLRAIANKRVQRLGLYEPRSEIYKTYKKGFRTYSSFKSRQGAQAELMRVSRFLAKKESTITGFKETQQRTLTGLHEAGYTFVNKNNLAQFSDYMSTMLSTAYASIYGSDRIAEAYNVAEKSSVSLSELEQDFDKFYKEHRNDIDG